MTTGRGKTFILVLNWNGWRDTLECLESLYSNGYSDCQVVLIDNNSEDDSLERIRVWAKDVNKECVEYDRKTAEQGGFTVKEEDPHALTIIRTGANLGFAGGNNVGIRYAQMRGAEYVLLLNNDAALRSKHAIKAMTGFMDEHPDAGACGGRLFYPDGSLQSSYGNFPSLSRALAYLFPIYKVLPKGMLKNFKRANVVPDDNISEPVAVDYPSGACLLVRGKTINEVGLLDERFFMFAEETDWCLRMMKQGWGRYYIPQAEVLHKSAGSFNKSTVTMNRYFLDSLFKYYRKNFITWHLWLLATGYLFRSLYSLLSRAIILIMMPEKFRSATQEQIAQWRLSLKLAVSTIRDLLSGKISREQDQSYIK